MTAVLLSIRPEWCEKIVNGTKTIEVRKTKPKLKMPFKCYIYCTKNGGEHKKIYNSYNVGVDYETAFACGMVIGEFICDSIKTHAPNNLIVEEDAEKALSGSCISREQMLKYLMGNKKSALYSDLTDFYGWHISDLVIYDKPKELSDFLVERDATTGCPILGKMNRPPQSWCYVEELEDVK